MACYDVASNIWQALPLGAVTDALFVRAFTALLAGKVGLDQISRQILPATSSERVTHPRCSSRIASYDEARASSSKPIARHVIDKRFVTRVHGIKGIL